MSEHTPGPWEVESNGEKYGSIITKDGKSMVTVWPEGLGGPIFPHEANARLIAAAPELLEALHVALEVMEAVDGENDCSRGIRTAEAAIAKATAHQQANRRGE